MKKHLLALATAALMQLFVVATSQAQAIRYSEAIDKDVVDVAVGSADHTTLVTALKAAELVVSLKNPGPFTVFAPTNAAFAKLPAGTVESLLEPGNKEQLTNILKYHVGVSTYKVQDLKDGMKLGMANGKNTTFTVKDGKVMINDANIVTSIRVSNGIVHVIDAVLLPPS